MAGGRASSNWAEHSRRIAQKALPLRGPLPDTTGNSRQSGGQKTMTATAAAASAQDPQQTIAELRRELAARDAELAAAKTALAEALAQQEASAEILQTINASPGDLAPVFDAMLEKAVRLCEFPFAALWTYDGAGFDPVAFHNMPAPFEAFLRERTPPGLEALRDSAGPIHLADVTATELAQRDPALTRRIQELGGVRTLLLVPLRKDNALLGAFVAYRQEVRPFTDKQIALLQNFAAQAVIAMENARLLGELRQRTTDLQEALEYQTATSEVLQVISRSAFDLDAVLRTVVSTAVQLCGGEYGVIFRNDGGEYRFAAGIGNSPEYEESERRSLIRPGRGTIIGRAALVGCAVQIADALTDPDYEGKAEAATINARTMLGVPLLREGQVIGAFGLARNRVEVFSPREVELVTTFADQAAIAIENSRLLGELRESLEQQQAIAEVLGVINANPGNLQPVFDAILEKAHRLCDSGHGTLFLRDGDFFRPAAMRGVPDAIAERLRAGVVGPDVPVSAPLLKGERFVRIIDTAQVDHPMMRLAHASGVRTLLSVPLRKGDEVLGMIVAARFVAPSFSGKQISLLENFAAQAVIAMDNARLLEEIRDARDAAEKALAELSATQQQLVVQQKMAALGQLTAGIAHEIKNPLNFVNNFAGVSNELLAELKTAAAPALETLDADTRADIGETFDMLAGNLDKIAEHGRRADGIVRSMLEHSRGGSGERRAVDLNALVDEALNLAYHGARAQDQNFNITLERDFAPAMAPIELVPQDATRVFLNLFGNGFYAATKKARAADGGFRPALRVATRDLGEAVEVTVRDNGTGIAPEIRNKLFQPFVTTKPTGEGTGLGLSISWDIVTHQHGGTIEVASEAGEFTEFTIRLPRGNGLTR
jgi:two-component system, NtrC family, sensor kinase